MPKEKAKEEPKKEEGDDKDMKDKEEKKEEKKEEEEKEKEMEDAPVEYETKIKTKTIETKLKFEERANPIFVTEDQLKNGIEFEKKLIKREEEVKIKQALKNDCESKS